MNEKESARMTSDRSPVLQTLIQFYEYALSRRDVKRAAELLTEDVFFVGTAESIADRQNFERSFREKLRHIPNRTLYEISDYREKARGENTWDCSCKIHLILPDRKERYMAKLTAVVLRENGVYRISVLHRGYIQKEERFPFHILSEPMGKMDQISKREIWDMICDVMPNGLIGAYMEEGYPIYLVSDKLLELLGYTYEEFMKKTGGNVLNRIWKEDLEEVMAAVKRQCREGKEFEVEYRMLKKDGNFLWVYDRGRIIDIQGEKKAVINLIVDISENVRIKNHLFMESVTDPLTGLYNRRGGEVMVAQRFGNGNPYIFLMMDIDNFKAVNDIYGHHEGDEVLRYIADLLRQFFRRDDVVIRIGGDEFVVFIYPCSSVAAIEQKIQKISERYLRKIEQEYPLSRSSLSFGGVKYNRTTSFLELYKRADQVLYKVKHNCKGQFKIVEMKTE